MSSLVSSYIDYLTWVRKYSSATIKSYETDLTQFQVYLKEYYDSDNIDDANASMIRSWMAFLKVDKKVSSRSIHRKISSLNGYYKFLKKEGTITSNPVQKIVLPKMKKKLPEFVSSSEMNRFQNGWETFSDDIKTARNTLIINLLYQTGMRRSELINLKFKNVDFSRMEIKVLGKGKKERIIPVQKRLLEEIENYRNLCAEQFIDNELCDAVILSDKGIQMNPKSLYNIVKQFLESARSTDKKSPHVLRHSFATHLLNNGADINAIKEILGHANLSATQVYTHNSIGRLKKVYRNAHPKA